MDWPFSSVTVEMYGESREPETTEIQTRSVGTSNPQSGVGGGFIHFGEIRENLCFVVCYGVTVT